MSMFGLTLEQAERERVGSFVFGSLATTRVLVADAGCSLLTKRFRKHTCGWRLRVHMNYRTFTQVVSIEPLDDTVRVTEIGWHCDETLADAGKHLGAFWEGCSNIRPHCAMRHQGQGDPLTPLGVYVHCKANNVPAPNAEVSAFRASLR